MTRTRHGRGPYLWRRGRTYEKRRATSHVADAARIRKPIRIIDIRSRTQVMFFPTNGVPSGRHVRPWLLILVRPRLPNVRCELPAPQIRDFRSPARPDALTGAIPLINETDTKLKLRSIGFRLATLKGPAGLPLGEVPFYATLYPGEQANVPATISLDPSTPPGEHQFELTIGKQTVAADALVEEVIDLRVDTHTTHHLGRQCDHICPQIHRGERR